MDEVAEVKNRLEITEVVSSYLPLKQAGRNLKAPCPFHQEKSGSFMVSPEKGIYKCFGCGEGGDIFNFVMKMEGVEFREALEMLARKAGVELTARKGDNKEASKLRDRLLRAHELAVKYYQASLVQNPKALEYVIKKRHLGKQTIKDFGIGYAPDSWNALSDFLASQGFSQRELVQGGLAGQKEGRTTVYDMFRGRIMFSITDREGRTIGFTGRVMDDSLPKYLNTPQTPLYDKSSAIFGLALAREAIRSSDEVVLVEGNMDVVASHQAGVKQVVAASGTALTLEQLRTLSKLTKNVKLAFDSDKAGLAATERAIDLGQKLGLTLRMVVLPEGYKDADELVQQDVELWKNAIAGAKYIVDYLFERFETDYDLTSAVGKRQFTDRVATTVVRLGDAVERDHYIKLLAEKVGASEEAVKEKIEAGEPATGAGAHVPVEASASHPSRRAVDQNVGRRSVRVQHEELFLAVSLMVPDARASLHDLSAERFSSPDRKVTYELMAAHLHSSGAELAETAGEVAGYINQLLMIADEEYGGIEEPKLQQTAFELARTVFLESNQQIKEQLSLDMRHAEQNGDKDAMTRLLADYKKIIDSEA